MTTAAGPGRWRAPHLTRAAVVLAAGQLAGRGALAIFLIAAIRLLDRSQYGDLAYVMTVAGIVVVLADAGFGRLLVRDLARPDGLRMRRRLLVLRGSAVVLAAVLLLAVTLVDALPLGPWVGVLLAAYVLCEGLALGHEAAAVGLEQPVIVAGAQAAGGAVLLGWLGALVLDVMASTPEAVVAGPLAAAATKLAVHLVAGRRISRHATGPISVTRRQHLGQALPFLIFSGLAVFYYRIDIVILHALAGANETAGYAAAYRVVDGLSVIGLVIFNSVAPTFSRIAATRPADIWPAWLRTIRLVAGGSAALAILVVALAPMLADLLFGGRYGDSATTLRLLAPGLALVLLGAVNGAAVLMAGGARAVVALTALGLAANVVLTCGGAALFGAYGTAIATSLSELISFVLIVCLLRSRHRRAMNPQQAP